MSDEKKIVVRKVIVKKLNMENLNPNPFEFNYEQFDPRIMDRPYGMFGMMKGSIHKTKGAFA